MKIDYRRLEGFVKGKSIIVTGGGGSIGAEICDRIVTFGAARVLVIENSEPALHAVLEVLATKRSAAKIEGRLADVRDRSRIFRLMADFRPDIVFHAAALKHVPLLERDWGEGVKTNVFGSVNVADAAVAAGAAAMVVVSTDKAIEPVSVLGASKRFAEMYCQALDNDLARRGDGHKRAMRLIAVRFGNVLASNGSVVPKFKAQIEAGGPLTVTHPEMVRYFMTIREACDLVVTAASHALEPGHAGVAVYVLNMGQPVKIVDLAERLIRLSGPRARPRHRHHVHRHPAGRAPARNPVRARRADGPDRHRGHRRGQAGQSAARRHARLAGGAGAGIGARGPLRDLRRAARRGAGFRRAKRREQGQPGAAGDATRVAAELQAGKATGRSSFAARKSREQPGHERRASRAPPRHHERRPRR